MLRIVARLSRRARTMPRRSPLTSVTPALSMATSVPVPIAMPTSACASAGASLMPSPAIATTRPSRLQPLDASRPSDRAGPRRSPRRCPSVRATASAVVAAVAGEHDDAQAFARAAPRSPPACVVLDRIGDAEHARRAVAVDGDEHHRLALGAQAVGALATAASRRDASRPSSSASCRRHALAVDRAAHALAGDGLEVAYRRERATPRASRARDDRRASGCSLPRSRLGGQRSSVVPRRTPASARTVTSRGLPSVSVPVLSTTSVSTLRSTSMRLGVPEQHAGVAPLPVATMIDIGVARPERARAGDDQHRDRVDQRVRQPRLRTDDRPDDEGRRPRRRSRPARSTPDDHVGQPLDRRAAALRLGRPSRRSAPAACRRRRARRA